MIDDVTIKKAEKKLNMMADGSITVNFSPNEIKIFSDDYENFGFDGEGFGAMSEEEKNWKFKNMVLGVVHAYLSQADVLNDEYDKLLILKNEAKIAEKTKETIIKYQNDLRDEQEKKAKEENEKIKKDVELLVQKLIAEERAK